MQDELRELAKFPKEICWLGNPILRKKADRVTSEEVKNGTVAKITSDLTKVLKKIQKMGRGVAIAAPQIGISKAVTVIAWENSYTPYINPVITGSSKNKNSFPEGCLSILPLIAEVIRSAEIDLCYIDENGDQQQKHFDGKLARIIQHEVDHLNGVLFIDRTDVKNIQFESNFEEYKNNAKLADL